MAKKRIPPEDVIREESEPPTTETEVPLKNPDTVSVDIDDALIDEMTPSSMSRKMMCSENLLRRSTL
jgi:hypothetical protein